ncbi:MAG: type II secretion system F family protein [Cytophagaceae bacterium]
MGVNISEIKQRQKKVAASSGNENVFAFLNKDIALFGNKLSDKKKETFYHEMHILLTAGIDIRTTLDLIAREQKKSKDVELFLKIKEMIIAGYTLSEAIRSTNKFTPYEYFSLQIGEETGKITIVLKELADYYQNKLKQRRQIIGALTYPGIVLFTSLVAVFFMMNFIVPMFAEVFKRFGGDLPYITALILSIADAMSEYFYVLVLILAGIYIFIYFNKKKNWYRKFMANAVLRMPVAGEMVRKIYLARFCQSMTLLIGSKIPLLKAIGLVRQMINYYPIEESLVKIEADILQGKPLHISMEAFKIYPPRMNSLIKVGEEVNQLDHFFGKIAHQFSEDVEHQTKMISNMIEPLMIIFLGLIVGVILIAMYLPLFQLSTTF